MLKSFWLNFVLTVAICLGGLSAVNSVAEIIDGDAVWLVACDPVNWGDCENQIWWCHAKNDHCKAAGPGRKDSTCICHSTYANAAMGNGICGCGDWFP
jgi:hypothetical protein